MRAPARPGPDAVYLHDAQCLGPVHHPLCPRQFLSASADVDTFGNARAPPGHKHEHSHAGPLYRGSLRGGPRDQPLGAMGQAPQKRRPLDEVFKPACCMGWRLSAKVARERAPGSTFIAKPRLCDHRRQALRSRVRRPNKYQQRYPALACVQAATKGGGWTRMMKRTASH